MFFWNRRPRFLAAAARLLRSLQPTAASGAGARLACRTMSAIDHGRNSRIAAPRFSFGGAADLCQVLRVRPGSVTPFALVNDVEHLVSPVLDAAMLDHDPLNYHPLANDRTTSIASADLLRFIAAFGHVPRIIDLAGFEREPAAAAG